MTEAECLMCGDTFIISDGERPEHVARENGDYCGGFGIIKGAWSLSSDMEGMEEYRDRADEGA